MTAWTALLRQARGVFTVPSFAIFTDLLTGWVLAPGRRTITAMIAVADPAGRRAHDAYHRFVRDGAWLSAVALSADIAVVDGADEIPDVGRRLAALLVRVVMV